MGGGCAGEAPTAGGGDVAGDGGGGSGGTRGDGGGDSEGGSSTKQQHQQQQGGERCPQCGILCRDVRVLQLHLEDTHKTSYTIDKHDLNAQFSQVVSDRDDPSRTHSGRLWLFASCAGTYRLYPSKSGGTSFPLKGAACLLFAHNFRGEGVGMSLGVIRDIDQLYLLLLFFFNIKVLR